MNLTDATGAVAAAYDYTAMGKRTETFTHILPLLPRNGTHIPARELNPHSGDHYFRYRTYGAGIGGFFSRVTPNAVDEGQVPLLLHSMLYWAENIAEIFPPKYCQRSGISLL